MFEFVGSAGASLSRFGWTLVNRSMVETPPITDRSRWLQDCNSMLISAFCNLAVMVALGLVSMAASDEWGGVKLFVNAGVGDSTFVEDSPLDETVELKVSAEPAAALGPVNVFDDIALPTADAATMDALSESAAKASGFEGLAMGGKAAGDGTGSAGAAEFFGIGGYGQTFVYVVDASDSMNQNGKFDRARYELLHSIEQLASDQRYFVIFYNDAAYPMDADAPVMATEDEFAKTADWVNNVQAGNGTNPLPALLHALSLRPDAIYFLSDGQFDPMAIQILRMRNKPSKRVGHRQIPIHTIAFVDYMTIGIMRTIARDSNGEHRFVR
jgi:hypothetical protein